MNIYDPAKRREKYLKNKDVYLKKCREYRQKNLEQIRKKDALRQRKAGGKPRPRLIFSTFKLRSVTQYLKSNINNKYLPYNIQELKSHIESQFEPWMTWDNLGKYS